MGKGARVGEEEGKRRGERWEESSRGLLVEQKTRMLHLRREYSWVTVHSWQAQVGGVGAEGREAEKGWKSKVGHRIREGGRGRGVEGQIRYRSTAACWQLYQVTLQRPSNAHPPPPPHSTHPTNLGGSLPPSFRSLFHRHPLSSSSLSLFATHATLVVRSSSLREGEGISSLSSSFSAATVTSTTLSISPKADANEHMEVTWKYDVDVARRENGKGG